MNFFGIGKLWSWVITGVGALALLGGAYYMIYQRGANQVRQEVAQTNNEKLDKAREADSQATETIIREVETIRHNTREVREVIREVPDTGLNPISRARLERVRRQQAYAGEIPNSTTDNTTELSSGTDSSVD